MEGLTVDGAGHLQGEPWGLIPIFCSFLLLFVTLQLRLLSRFCFDTRAVGVEKETVTLAEHHVQRLLLTGSEKLFFLL